MGEVSGARAVLIYLCDAAFTPHTAQLDETASDTERTSFFVAARTMVRDGGQ
ncbi:hypothetical protein ACFWZY_28710 [Streptomyces sp. NPDC058992]|uniref:hypothetical protein n=1 Tax=Streptomyces sp. NPDC058992 TaxID=3346688 RepID=UPI0036BCFFC2